MSLYLKLNQVPDLDFVQNMFFELYPCYKYYFPFFFVNMTTTTIDHIP